MISHKHKCIFIHIPKTAGTSLSSFYFPNKKLNWEIPNYELLYGWCPKRQLHLQHATSKQLLETELITEEQWKEYFKFTFVRNPYDRSYSDYLWIIKDRNVIGSFEEYIHKKGNFTKILNDRRDKTYRGDHLLPQTSFFDFEGTYKLDFVGRFENLYNDVIQINHNLGIEENFDIHVQKGKERKKHYKHFFNAQRKKWVEVLYKDDLELLTYKFEPQNLIIEKLKNLFKY